MELYLFLIRFLYGKVSVPVPDPNPDLYKNLAFLMLEATLLFRKLSSHFSIVWLFILLSFHFISVPDSNLELDLEPDLKRIPVPVPLRQNVPVPTRSGSGSVSTTLLTIDLNYLFVARSSSKICNFCTIEISAEFSTPRTCYKVLYRFRPPNKWQNKDKCGSGLTTTESISRSLIRYRYGTVMTRRMLCSNGYKLGLYR